MTITANFVGILCLAAGCALLATGVSFWIGQPIHLATDWEDEE